MARLDKTLQNYQKQLKDKRIKDIPDFIQSILDADITKGKYSRFLLDCYIQDKFREEDLKGGLESTVGQAISLFHKHKRRLPEGMRSVYKYESPGDLWNAVKQFDGELSGKEIKKDEKEKIYAETEFVYTDEETEFKVISPLTEDSAKWWGKGTRWCTSADKNNQFWNYADQAPLLIFLMPGGEKLQLWKNKDDIQFMDESDNSISLEYIEKNWDILEPIGRYICHLEYIPKKYRNEEIYKLIVQKNGYYLKHVPEKFHTKDVYEAAIQKDGLLIFYIDKKFRTKSLLEMAVKNNWRALYHLKEEEVKIDLCIIALLQDIRAYNYIPQKYKQDTEIMEIYHNHEQYKTSENKKNNKEDTYQNSIISIKKHFQEHNTNKKNREDKYVNKKNISGISY